MDYIEKYVEKIVEVRDRCLIEGASSKFAWGHLD